MEYILMTAFNLEPSDEESIFNQKSERKFVRM